jgi:hypothetical protein
MQRETRITHERDECYSALFAAPPLRNVKTPPEGVTAAGYA